MQDGRVVKVSKVLVMVMFVAFHCKSVEAFGFFPLSDGRVSVVSLLLFRCSHFFAELWFWLRWLRLS